MIDAPEARHVVADLRFRDAREVEFVRCVCGRRAGSLADWQAHLAAAGQHPNVSELGRVGNSWQSQAMAARRRHPKTPQAHEVGGGG